MENSREAEEGKKRNPNLIKPNEVNIKERRKKRKNRERKYRIEDPRKISEEAEEKKNQTYKNK